MGLRIVPTTILRKFFVQNADRTSRRGFLLTFVRAKVSPPRTAEKEKRIIFFYRKLSFYFLFICLRRGTFVAKVPKTRGFRFPRAPKRQWLRP